MNRLKHDTVPFYTPAVPASFFLQEFDWCPEISNRNRIGSNEKKRKPPVDKKRIKMKGGFHALAKNFAIPDFAAEDGPVIDGIVGGTDVDPTLKYKVSRCASSRGIRRCKKLVRMRSAIWSEQRERLWSLERRVGYFLVQ